MPNKKQVSYASALNDAHEAVNALGGVPSTPDEEEYGRALDEVLWAIEALQLEAGTKELEHKLEAMLAQLRSTANELGSVTPADSSTDRFQQRFVNVGPDVKQGAATVARSVSKTFAKRIAVALNNHKPNREGV